MNLRKLSNRTVNSFREKQKEKRGREKKEKLNITKEGKRSWNNIKIPDQISSSK